KSLRQMKNPTLLLCSLPVFQGCPRKVRTRVEADEEQRILGIACNKLHEARGARHVITDHAPPPINSPDRGEFRIPVARVAEPLVTAHHCIQLISVMHGYADGTCGLIKRAPVTRA